VGESNGQITLYVSDQLNVDHHTYSTDDTREETTVPVCSLDAFFRDEAVHFIKMDIQGYEYYALWGMREILLRNRDVALLMEFWPYGLKQARSEPAGLVAMLLELGFRLEIMQGSRLKACPPIPDSDDPLFYCTMFAHR
jgi:hypothetical protein